MDNLDELKGWIRKAKEANCKDYLAMAINKNKFMLASVEADQQSMFEMLTTFCKQNEAFKEVLISVAAYCLQTENHKPTGKEEAK